MPTPDQQRNPGTQRPSGGGAGITYRERLRPPVWVWVIVEALVAMLAVAYGAALGAAAGIATMAIVGGAAAWVLAATSPEIIVSAAELRAGRAHIAWKYVGIIATLDAESTKLTRGAEADPRAFALMRPLTAAECVTIEICDDADPHPYWLISTKHPDELGRAIHAARQAALNSASPVG